MRPDSSRNRRTFRQIMQKISLYLSTTKFPVSFFDNCRVFLHKHPSYVYARERFFIWYADMIISSSSPSLYIEACRAGTSHWLGFTYLQLGSDYRYSCQLTELACSNVLVKSVLIQRADLENYSVELFAHLLTVSFGES